MLSYNFFIYEKEYTIFCLRPFTKSKKCNFNKEVRYIKEWTEISKLLCLK